MKKVLIIFGTRPEAIKMAPVIKRIEEEKSFDVKVCVTAQHRQLLDDVLNIFDIIPDFDLNLMKENQRLSELTSEAILEIKKVIEATKPDLVLIQGDTTTTFVSSLVAFYNRVKIGHIEAGLRTGNKYSPFPEEMNRQMTACLSDFHFAPTEGAKRNLQKEGVSTKNIFVTGNTAIDTLLITLDKIRNQEVTTNILKKIELEGKKFILVTAHRRESFGEVFNNICLALLEITENNPDIEIVYPVHLNPNVQNPVKKILMNKERIHLIKPLDYISFVTLMSKAYFILTDSGGIQEEAPVLGKPVLVLRNETERLEAVEAGTVKVVGTDTETIINETERLLYHKNSYAEMSKAKSPYGDGHAAERIVKILLKSLI